MWVGYSWAYLPSLSPSRQMENWSPARTGFDEDGENIKFCHATTGHLVLGSLSCTDCSKIWRTTGKTDEQVAGKNRANPNTLLEEGMNKTSELFWKGNVSIANSTWRTSSFNPSLHHGPLSCVLHTMLILVLPPPPDKTRLQTLAFITGGKTLLFKFRCNRHLLLPEELFA